MKKLKEFTKKISEFYQRFVKYSLWFFVAISVCDLYFYLQIYDQRFTNLFIDFRVFVAAIIILHGIYVICKQLWKYRVLKRSSDAKNACVITLDLEPLVCTQKTEPKKYRYKDTFKGTKEDDLMIKDLILHVKSIDIEIQQLALSKLSKILHRPKPFINNMVENGILPILVEFLQSERILLQHIATLMILTIIKKTHSCYTKDIVEAGAIPSLIELLKEDKIREDSLKVLRIISNQFNDLCVENGIIDSLIENCIGEEMSENVLSTIISLIVRLCDPSSNKLIPSENAHQLLSLIEKLPFEEYPNAINDVIDLIEELKWNGRKYIELLFDCNIFNLVIDYLEDSDETTQKRAFEVFTEILTPNEDEDDDDNESDEMSTENDEDEQKTLKNDEIDSKKPTEEDIENYQQNLIDSNILSIADNIFTEADSELKEEILKFIGSLATGNETKIQALIDADFIQLLLDLLSDDKNNNSLLQTSFETLLNVAKSANSEQTLLLIDLYDIFSIFVQNYLKHENLDYRKLALTCINQLLKKSFENDETKEVCKQLLNSGCFAEIQQIQMHPRLNHLANDIVKDYMNLKNNIAVIVNVEHV